MNAAFSTSIKLKGCRGGVGRKSVLNMSVVQLQSHVWLFCDPMDCSQLGSSIHGISQARILEWAAISSRGRDPGIEPIFHLLHWQVDSLPEPSGKPLKHEYPGTYIFANWLEHTLKINDQKQNYWAKNMYNTNNISPKPMQKLFCFPLKAKYILWVIFKIRSMGNQSHEEKPLSSILNHSGTNLPSYHK